MNAPIFHRTNLTDLKQDKNRPVILHYHIFKNAGSSVDAMLQKCFPDSWTNYDGPVPEFFINQTEMEVIARNRSQLKAISSHQIRLPVPQSEFVDFLPIIFIRRPELRVASIWRFMRQRPDAHPATLLAQKYNFKDWVNFTLDQTTAHPSKNSQTATFCFTYDKRVPVKHPRAKQNAFKNMESVPFIGLVEEFDQSIKIYENLYSPRVPEFKFISVEAQNVTNAADLSPQDQLDKIASEIGHLTFSRLQAANQIDIKLYNIAKEKFDRELGELYTKLDRRF